MSGLTKEEPSLVIEDSGLFICFYSISTLFGVNRLSHMIFGINFKVIREKMK